MEEGFGDLVKNSFSNYFDIEFGFTLQKVIVIYLLICLKLLNHKIMISSCVGINIGVSQMSRCPIIDYTSVSVLQY